MLPSRMKLTRAIAALLMSAVIASTVGCAGKSKTQAREREAFIAGQKQFAMAAEMRRSNIAVTGPVSNQLVIWREGITLAEAIVAARWNAPGDPRLVVLTRKGERVELTPNESLAAAQLPLEPGDEIELIP